MKPKCHRVLFMAKKTTQWTARLSRKTSCCYNCG